MNDQFSSDLAGFGYAVPSAAERNRVLRNTYWLLALSLIPTVLGAWIGVATGLMAALGMGLSLVLFIGGSFGFMYAIEKTKNSGWGVALLLGFSLPPTLPGFVALVAGITAQPTGGEARRQGEGRALRPRDERRRLRAPRAKTRPRPSREWAANSRS